MVFVLTRRQSLTLAAAACLAASPAGAAFRHFPKDGEWLFSALSADKPVGEHRIGFRRAGNVLLVRSDSTWQLARPYQQHVEERWVDGWLRGLISDTRYGAETWQVRAEWQHEALRGHRNGNAFSVAGYSIPHTFWHPESPHVRELLDPRDAGLKIIESFAIGQRELMVEGEPRRALGYRLNGSIEGALWYDGAGALLAATVTLPDGAMVDLHLRQVIEERSG